MSLSESEFKMSKYLLCAEQALIIVTYHSKIWQSDLRKLRKLITSKLSSKVNQYV